MGMSSFYSAFGGADSLGLRRAQGGELEIVYDDGVARHKVWRLRAPDGRLPREAQLGRVLQSALAHERVLPALQAELRRRGLSLEAVTG